jgi:hypothetical protein
MEGWTGKRSRGRRESKMKLSDAALEAAALRCPMYAEAGGSINSWGVNLKTKHGSYSCLGARQSEKQGFALG